MLMDWVRENWVFLLFLIIFIWMHASGMGCGGHGHGGHGKKGEGHEGHSEKKSP